MVWNAVTWNAQIKRSRNVLSLCFCWLVLSVCPHVSCGFQQLILESWPSPDKLLLLEKKLQVCGMPHSPLTLFETHTRTRTLKGIPSPWFSSPVATRIHLSYFYMFDIPHHYKSTRKCWRLKTASGSEEILVKAGDKCSDNRQLILPQLLFNLIIFFFLICFVVVY